MKAQKSILMIQFLMVISRYFTVLVSDCQYQVLDRIILESICINFSQYQTCDPYFSGRQSGEYFGAAVAAVDLNGDGIDEVPILSVVFFLRDNQERLPCANLYRLA